MMFSLYNNLGEKVDEVNEDSIQDAFLLFFEDADQEACDVEKIAPNHWLIIDGRFKKWTIKP